MKHMHQKLFSYKSSLQSLLCLLLLIGVLLSYSPLICNATSTIDTSSLCDGNGTGLSSFQPTVISTPENYDNPLVNNYTSCTSDIAANLPLINEKSLYFTMPINGRLDLTMEEQNGSTPTIYFYNTATNLMASSHFLQDGYDRFVIDLAKDTTYRIAFDTNGQVMNIKMIFKIFSIMNNSDGSQEYLANSMYVYGKDYDNSDLNTTLYNRDNYIRIALKQKSDLNVYKRILAPPNPDLLYPYPLNFIWPLSIYPCEQYYAINEATAINVPGNTSLYIGSNYTATLEPGIYYISVGNIGSYFAFQYTLIPHIDAVVDVIPPLITSVTANAIYNKSQTLNFTDEGSGIYCATLNDAKIANGYEVTKEGSYTLKVTDIVDNSTTLQFQIDKTKPTISGVKNNTTYKTKQIIKFSDAFSGIHHATLNNVVITSGTKVSKLGVYTLCVYDNAGNIKTITFTLDSLPTITGVKADAIYRSTRKITFSDKNGIKKATLNGSKLKNHQYVITSGKYTLKVTDKKKNSITVKFTIDKKKPMITGVTHNRTYYSPIKIKISDSISGIKKATLNGNSIQSGKKVTKKGTYTLKVYDKAGNSRVIVFFMR